MHCHAIRAKASCFIVAAAAFAVSGVFWASSAMAAGVHVPQAGSRVSVVYVRQVHGYSRQVLDTKSKAPGQGAAGTTRREAPRILEFEAPARKGADMLPVPRVVVP